MKVVPVKKLVEQIAHEHDLARKGAEDCVRHTINCGRLLLALKASCEHGDWVNALKPIDLSKTTAWRYMRVAQDAAKRKNAHLLEAGASLVDLYREFGLVKALEGGGYRSEAYKRRKALADVEEQLDFAFEEFEAGVRSLINAPNVEKLSERTLLKLREDLTHARVRVDDVLARKNAIEIGDEEIVNRKS